MSARAVSARPHGPGSPAYPAAEWRRKEKAGNLWEKHSRVDFGAIVRVASEELLAMRGVVPKVETHQGWGSTPRGGKASCYVR